MSDELGLPPFDGEQSDALWGGGGLFDPLSGDSFRQEIADIDAAVWDQAADELWSDDTAEIADPGDDTPLTDLFG